MIVECPACNTNFPVDPKKVPTGGIHARCTVCSEVFFVNPPPSEQPTPLTEPGEGLGSAEPDRAADVDVGEGLPDEGLPAEVTEAEEDEEVTFGTQEIDGAQEIDPSFSEDSGVAVEEEVEVEVVSDSEFGDPEFRDPEFGDSEDALEAEFVEERREGEFSGEPLEVDVMEDAGASQETDFEDEAMGAEFGDEAGFGEVEEVQDADFSDDSGFGGVVESTEEAVGSQAGFGEMEPSGGADWDEEAGFDAVPVEPDLSRETDEEAPAEEDAPPPGERDVLATGGEDLLPPGETEETSSAQPAPVFGKRDPRDKAQRLARVLVSDIILYNPDRHQAAMETGNLKEEFEEEIQKSWAEYVDQVGDEIAETTPYFTDALNEILAKGEDVF